MRNKTTLILLAILSVNVVIVAIIPSFGDTQLTTNLGEDWAPDVVQTNDGKIWVFWHSYRPSNANASLFYKTYDGMSWSDDTPLTNDPLHTNGAPSAVQLNNGTIIAVWTSDRFGNRDLFYKSTSDGGLSWSSETRLTTDPNDDELSSILQSDDGAIWVFWDSRRTGDYEIFYKTYNVFTRSWSNDMRLTFDASDDREPSAMLTTDGTLWIFWDSTRTGNRDLFCKFSFDNGESWSEDIQITSEPFSDISPSAVQTIDGTILVAWQTMRPDGNYSDIYYKLYDGFSWSLENQLVWDNEPLDLQPAVLQATNGTIWLVWMSNKPNPPTPQNNDIYYKFATVDMAIKKIELTYVSNLTDLLNVLNPGDLLNVNTYFKNEGTVGVSCQVTNYYNGIPIGTKTFSSVFPQPFSFYPQPCTTTLDTAGLPYGYYVISATVSTNLSDTDPTDNTLIGDTLILTIPGDVNGDKHVDIQDASLISAHWYPGPPAGSMGYRVQYDINKDGKIDVRDNALLNGNWFKSW